MTGSGDGLNPQSLNDLLADAAKSEETGDPPSPLGDLSQLAGIGDEHALVEDSTNDGSSSSIFDEPIPQPMSSESEIPDAIPNISDGGTEIFTLGRAELQDFSETFVDEVEPTGVIDPTTMDTWIEGEEFPRINPDAQAAHSPSTSLGERLLNQLEDAATDTNVSNSMTGDDASSVPAESVTETETAPPASGESGVLDLGSLSTDDSTTGNLAIESQENATADGSVLSLDVMRDAVSATTTHFGSAGRESAAVAPASNRVLLLALGGYAAVVTLLCLLLLSLLAKARAGGQLESLPDIAPEPAGKMSLTPANAILPHGHLLALGESQKYGHLRVEPLRITRAPLRFVYAGTTGEQGFQSEPVLKLWVRFTNESKTQSVVPLDGKLLFRRSKDNVRANNFVVRKPDHSHGSPLVMMHHDPLLNEPDWSLEKQQLGHELLPGESMETYLPTTEEGIDQLSGELIWRMHVRKGHSPSGNGVTTLVEVLFREDQIEVEGT